MIELLSVYVRGNPAPMPRPRARVVPGGPGRKPHADVYNPERYGRDDPKGRCGQKMPWLIWKEQIIRCVLGVRKFDQAEAPMRLDVDFHFARPDRLLKPSSPAKDVPHISRPDLDNLIKLVKDALTECGVWKDDGQCCKTHQEKQYVDRGMPAGARIVVTQLAEADPALFEKIAPVEKIEQAAKPSKFTLGEPVNWKTPNGEREGIVQAIHGELGEMLTVKVDGTTVQVDSFIHEVNRGRIPGFNKLEAAVACPPNNLAFLVGRPEVRK